MAENSKIEWTDHTFNPWTGCTKVSPECDHCYAEGWAKRSGAVKWGPGEPRRRTTVANWRKPIQWNRQAEQEGIRYRVFCASLADVFDTEIDPQWRIDLLRLIRNTPYLDWLLLTKRHSVAHKFLPTVPLSNVRIGMTVGNKDMAQMRLPYLAKLALNGWKTFVSYEPALGPVDWWPWLDPEGIAGGCIHWLICGGESGGNARPMHPDWARAARDACIRAGVPFFFKQNGEFVSVSEVAGEGPHYTFPDGATVRRIGKKAAGRTLDGRTWDEFPA